MPAVTARKIEAWRADFRSAAQLADLLGVSRSQVTRWLRGAGIDPLNAEKVDLISRWPSRRSSCQTTRCSSTSTTLPCSVANA